MGTVLSNMSPTPDNLVSALLPLFLLCKPGILDRNKTEMNLGNLDVGTNSSNDLKHSWRGIKRGLPGIDISTTTTTSAPAQRSEKEFEQKNPFTTFFPVSTTTTNMKTELTTMRPATFKLVPCLNTLK